jgi:hypothetical protein
VISNATLPARARERVPCGEILRDAAQYLAENGWFQGDMFATPDQYLSAACTLGAIRMSTSDAGVEFVTASQVFADHLVRHHQAAPVDDWANGLPIAEEIVSRWNDDPDRLASHVIATLIEAGAEWDRIQGGAA